MYGQWVCPVCDENNSSDDLGKVADLVDHNIREGK